MEIDFLGLNSKDSPKTENGLWNNPFMDSAIGGADTSLSLSTSSSVDCERETMDFGENDTWAVPISKMLPKCSSSLEKAPVREQSSLAFVPTPHNVSSTMGFLYDLNKKPTDLRSISEPSAQPALLTILYSGSAHVFHEILPGKANRIMCMAGKSSMSTSSTEQSTRGSRYTPTVAMARKATVARFLEKRMHRLVRTGALRLTKKSPDISNSQAWNVSMMCGKKKNTIISAERPQSKKIRRQDGEAPPP